MGTLQCIYARKAHTKNGGHYAHLGDKLCGRPCDKITNMVIIAVVGFIYFWRKMKAFQ